MVISGVSNRRLLTASLGVAAAIAVPDPAAAQNKATARLTLHIAATTLDRAILDLARQAGVDIVSTEPGLSSVRVAGIDGHMDAATALSRLLATTPFRAVKLRGGYRIVAARPPRVRQAAVARPAPLPAGEIIVTASKRDVDLSHYPGSLYVADLGQRAGLRPTDDDAIAASTPIIEQTRLGPGRNKLFVRGIADSSFTGATQSTVSVYFGDVQLAYSGADPDIKLVDVARVEVLEGPQGTLYGAGAIGGIVRITPNPVDLTGVHGAINAGASATIGGAAGFDGSAAVNVPLMRDTLGLRAVGYRTRDGGYINDGYRKLSDINRTDTVGARLALAVRPGGDWSVDVGGLWQSIDTADTGHSYAGTPDPLVRRSRLAQPFNSDITQLRFSIGKQWSSGLQLASATGYVSYRSTEIFDASTGLIPTQIYLNGFDNELWTQETRLSRLNRRSSWVLGFALLQNTNAQNRQFGPKKAPSEIVGVTNIARSASVFGEVTANLWSNLRVTGGVRATLGRIEATPSGRGGGAGFFGGQKTMRVDPTLALTYQVAAGLSAYARFQTGYRTGGLAVARGVGRVAEFKPDDIIMGEGGLRYRRAGTHPLSFNLSIAHAHWTNIQADLFSSRGQPYTANLGNAQIFSVEASGEWEPLRGVKLNAAMLFTSNDVSGPIADTSIKRNRRLAQVPNAAANAGLSYRWQTGRADTLEVGVRGQYVGSALLGTGDFLDIPHPAYFKGDASGSWTRGPVTTTLAVDNLVNSHASQFSLGNPLILAARNQLTPLRPLTVRFGIGVTW